jgi:hypothetical protein
MHPSRERMVRTIWPTVLRIAVRYDPRVQIANGTHAQGEHMQKARVHLHQRLLQLQGFFIPPPFHGRPVRQASIDKYLGCDNLAALCFPKA